MNGGIRVIMIIVPLNIVCSIYSLVQFCLNKTIAGRKLICIKTSIKYPRRFMMNIEIRLVMISVLLYKICFCMLNIFHISVLLDQKCRRMKLSCIKT